MIIVTGSAGMIGSAFVWKLNEMGEKNILLVDKLRTENKWLNIRKREYADWLDRDDLKEWLAVEENAKKIEAVVHMGACSATTEQDGDFLMDNNYGYTKFLWDFCSERKIKFIYASSAATYGMGELGYNDEVSSEELQKLQPLNKYGYSKKIFDDWAFKQEKTPSQWYGLKFFNVYGPQEYHKGRMASMVFHSFNQYKTNGKIKLFKSHKDGFKDGEQLRDFVYVKDVVDIMYYLLKLSDVEFRNKEVGSGIFNIGTGKCRSFLDLSMATVNSLKKSKNEKELAVEDVIEFIPMPEDLRGKYQYFTEAKNEKIRKIGYTKKLSTLEEGVYDYVVNYLVKEDSYL
ncbi:MAG: ADP-glyceromanno-heptose 6-epimerase [Fusobacterium sp.]|nr:ADP-glyceromanno-heptose 6-epimerase [Fusobacterium sp.]